MLMPIITFVGFINFLVNMNGEPSRRPITRRQVVSLDRSRKPVYAVEMRVIAQEIPLTTA